MDVFLRYDMILLMAEIRRSPVEVGSLSTIIFRVSYILSVVGNGISTINSIIPSLKLT